VCEGQQMDMDFESKDIVAIEEYLQMIKLKTAVLLGAALKYGGILAKAKDSDLENIYNFGVHLGMAFQIQDDYLDTFGDQAVFGKRIGGDIIDRKKTFLFIKALQNADSKDQKYLLDLYKNNDIDEAELIEKTINFFKNQKVDKLAQAEIALYTNKAINNLKNTSLPDNEKNFWLQFANDLMYRQS
jgi:geranylgeranyl diphosphate synthase type II